MDGNDLSKIDIKICVIVFVKFSSTSKKLGRIGADAILGRLASSCCALCDPEICLASADKAPNCLMI
jgi:hypothetical protein